MSWVTKTIVFLPSFHSRSRSSCSWVAGLRIERAERLVHQDHRRIVGQRADQRGALAHAAGEFVRIMILEPAKADRADQHIGALARLGIEPALHFEREQHVLQRRSPGQQIVFLRDVADAARQSPGLSAFGSSSGDVSD